MTKSRYTLSVLIVLGLTVSIGMFTARVDHAATGIPDPCSSTSQIPGPAQLLICPDGDGETLAEVGAIIEIRIVDPAGYPISGIPGADFWLDACYDGLVLCYGSQSSSADLATDADGRTTISGTIAAGGCSDGLVVWVQGIPLVGGPSCDSPQCLAIEVRSVDITGDLVVDLLDLTRFAYSYLNANFEPCHDLNFDDAVDLLDLTVLAFHFYHECL